jgi:hypothetical protein
MTGLLLVGGAARAQTNAPSPAPSLEAIAKAFFEANPNREITQQEATAHIRSLRPDAQDPWRTVRKLYQDGWLIKVRKGVYQRIPGHAGRAVDEHFTPSVREEIYRHDHSRCVVCGNGPHNGHEIHADHIRPRQLGGQSTVENGQTLCSEHNLLKKTYGTYDFYAHLVSRHEQEARSANDTRHAEMLAKIQSILREYGCPSRTTPPDGSADPSPAPSH